MRASEVTESGWYFARHVSARFDDKPEVVRVQAAADQITTVWRIGSRDPSVLQDWQWQAKVYISGRVADIALAEAQADGVRQGREEAHAEQVEFEAKRDREHPEFTAGIRLDLTGQGKGIVAIRIPVEHADGLSHSLSDFLCWARGYNAGLPRDDYDRAPIGVEAIRDINIALKTALERADEAEENSHG